MLSLRPYQEDAIDAIGASAARTQLVALPTGTGKTIVFSELIRRRGGTALILAHRDELLTQAAAKLATVAPELALSMGTVKGERDETAAPIVLASVQTLAHTRRLERLPRRFDTVVIDEAHHATAPSYRRILEHTSLSPLAVGFTATPERADSDSLASVFDELVFARSLEEMIRAGYLCDLRALRIELADLDLRRVKKSRGDFQAEDLGRAMEAAHAVEHSVAAWTEHAHHKRTIAFFPTVALAHEAAAAFRDAGYDADAVDGTTPTDRRRHILAGFSSGDIEIVCNVGVLTEGFDEPGIECVLLCTPTKSRIRYAQMVGRGTRTAPNKTDCLILDLAGVTETLGLQSVGALFGLEAEPAPGETATAARDRELAKAAEESEAEAQRQRLEVERTAAREVRLFDRDSIHWLHSGERWVLGHAGDTLIVLDPQGSGAWRVLLMGPSLARIFARNLDLGYAQGVAEEIIRREKAIALAHTDAPWRRKPASDGQRRYLRRLGQRPPDDATKGEAADLITTAIAAERLERFDRAQVEVTAA